MHPIPVDIHDTLHISGIISRSSLADQSGYSHVDQCVTKTIRESAYKQDIVMDTNSSTPMEGSTRVPLFFQKLNNFKLLINNFQKPNISCLSNLKFNSFKILKAKQQFIFSKP